MPPRIFFVPKNLLYCPYSLLSSTHHTLVTKGLCMRLELPGGFLGEHHGEHGATQLVVDLRNPLLHLTRADSHLIA